MIPRIVCLIPAYNEAARIATVMAAVEGHPLLAEVLVIDDGSNDGTAEIAKKFAAKVIRTPGNLGKTRALAFGLRWISADYVLLLDADLIGLTEKEVSKLLRPVIEGQAGASISLRGNAPLIWRAIGLDYISGERVVPLALLINHLGQLETLPRFGFEVFLNRLLIIADMRVAIVPWPAVASPSKASKRGLLEGIKADISMIADIFQTITPLQSLQQIRDLRRLSQRPPTRRPQTCKTRTKSEDAGDVSV